VLFFERLILDVSLLCVLILVELILLVLVVL